MLTIEEFKNNMYNLIIKLHDLARNVAHIDIEASKALRELAHKANEINKEIK